MNGNIVVAGNLIVDHVKLINKYPQPGKLSNILSVSRGCGGCATNTSIDLARLDPSLPVICVGRLGLDENGRYLQDLLHEHGVDTRHITYSDEAGTAYTDVMTDTETGERTLFVCNGANAEFAPEHIPFAHLTGTLFHIGYPLLLDTMDEPDPVFGTKLARTLHTAQAKGFKTSMDVVTHSTGRFQEIVTPSLKYCDYVVMNELESSMIVGIPARAANGSLLTGNVRAIAEALLDKGVKDLVVIHAPEGGFALDRQGNYEAVPSLRLPRGYIKGTVGAGDAFGAGILYAVYKGYDLNRMVRFANCAAAASLAGENSVDGLMPASTIFDLESSFKMRTSFRIE